MLRETDEGILYAPSEAARLLRVSVSALRRYGSLYEELYGDLPRDSQGRRLWTADAVARLRAAKARLAAGDALSITAALQADDSLHDARQSALSVAEEPDPPNQALRRLGEALTTLVQLEETNRQLVCEVAALREKLEQGDPNAEELRRMNAYLQGELERRGKGTTSHRSWWRFWQR